MMTFTNIRLGTELVGMLLNSSGKGYATYGTQDQVTLQEQHIRF